VIPDCRSCTLKWEEMKRWGFMPVWSTFPCFQKGSFFPFISSPFLPLPSLTITTLTPDVVGIHHTCPALGVLAPSVRHLTRSFQALEATVSSLLSFIISPILSQHIAASSRHRASQLTNQNNTLLPPSPRRSVPCADPVILHNSELTCGSTLTITNSLPGRSLVDQNAYS